MSRAQTKPTADVCNPGNLSAVRGKEDGDVKRGKEKGRKNISRSFTQWQPWASTRGAAVLGAGDYSVLRNAQLGKDRNDQGYQVTGLSG